MRPATRLPRLALLLLAGCAGGPRREPVAVIEIAPAKPEPAAAASAEKPPPAPPPASPPLVGHWIGVGVQASGATWAMDVELTSLGPGLCGHARYPSIPCTADWICGARSDGRSLQATERVTDGQNRCIDGGTMNLKLTPQGELSWRWAGSGETARAELARMSR